MSQTNSTQSKPRQPEITQQQIDKAASLTDKQWDELRNNLLPNDKITATALQNSLTKRRTTSELIDINKTSTDRFMQEFMRRNFTSNQDD